MDGDAEGKREAEKVIVERYTRGGEPSTGDRKEDDTRERDTRYCHLTASAGVSRL